MVGDIYAVGLNYKTAPVELREKLSCNIADLDSILQVLKASTDGVKGFMLLSTCNRLEFYAHAYDEKYVLDAFKRYLDIKNQHFDKTHFFLKAGKEAVIHIFKVASGLDSMVIGEPQIVAQFKEAFLKAKSLGTTGKVVNRLCQNALHASKRVRYETGISKSAVSVSYAAVELAKRIFGELTNHKVLLIGTGEMGELAAKYLQRSGASIYISNRTYERAIALAENIRANVIRFEEIEQFLYEFDVVLVSTGAQGYVLTKDVVAKSMKKRHYKPIFLIDISVPRNIEPSCADLDSVFLYNIDDLKEVVENNLSNRFQEAKKGEFIILDEADKFYKWLENLELEPIIINMLDYTKNGSKDCKKIVHRAIKLIRENKEYTPLVFELLGIKFNEKEINYGFVER
ncbi:glutamyl-tRNA reductase [Hydrogenobaculum acidophilum]